MRVGIAAVEVVVVAHPGPSRSNSIREVGGREGQKNPFENIPNSFCFVNFPDGLVSGGEGAVCWLVSLCLVGFPFGLPFGFISDE